MAVDVRVGIVGLRFGSCAREKFQPARLGLRRDREQTRDKSCYHGLAPCRSPPFKEIKGGLRPLTRAARREAPRPLPGEDISFLLAQTRHKFLTWYTMTPCSYTEAGGLNG